jgi:hypothetical protein
MLQQQQLHGCWHELIWIERYWLVIACKGYNIIFDTLEGLANNENAKKRQHAHLEQQLMLVSCRYGKVVKSKHPISYCGTVQQRLLQSLFWKTSSLGKIATLPSASGPTQSHIFGVRVIACIVSSSSMMAAGHRSHSRHDVLSFHLYS